jgi:hypothetical protein
MTDRYLVRYRGPVDSDQYESDLKRIFSIENARVVEVPTPGMLTVESGNADLQKIIESMAGWRAYPMTYYDLPEQRPMILRGVETEQAAGSYGAAQKEQLEVQHAPRKPRIKAPQESTRRASKKAKRP